MDISERARIHAALADPLRLRIVDILSSRQEVCGKELAELLGASVALVSHHAKLLEDAGLLLRRRDGQFVRFSLNLDRMDEVRGSLEHS
jgi:DNA-binding transcriptional ArsR family regulator